MREGESRERQLGGLRVEVGYRKGVKMHRCEGRCWKRCMWVCIHGTKVGISGSTPTSVPWNVGA